MSGNFISEHRCKQWRTLSLCFVERTRAQRWDPHSRSSVTLLTLGFLVVKCVTSSSSCSSVCAVTRDSRFTVWGQGFPLSGNPMQPSR